MKCTKRLTPEEQKKILDDLRKAAASGRGDTSSKEAPYRSSYDRYNRENGQAENGTTEGASSENANQTGQNPTGASSQPDDSTSNTTGNTGTQGPFAEDINNDSRQRTADEFGEGASDQTSGTNGPSYDHTKAGRKNAKREERKQREAKKKRAREGQPSAQQENLEVPYLEPSAAPTMGEKFKAFWTEWMTPGGYMDSREMRQVYEGNKAVDRYSNIVTDGFVTISEKFDQGLRMMDGIMRSTSKNLVEAIERDYPDGISGKAYEAMSAAVRGNNDSFGELEPNTRRVIAAMRSDMDRRTGDLIVSLDAHLDRLKNVLVNDRGTADYLANTRKIYSTLSRQRDAMSASLDAMQRGDGSSFIHRAYNYNASQAYRDEVKRNPQMQAAARRMFAQIHYAAAADRQQTITQGELKGLVNASIQEIFEKMDSTGGTAMHVTNADKVLLSDVYAFRDLQDVPVQIREMLGEIKDPMVNYATTVQQQNLLSISLRYADQMLKSGIKYGMMSTTPTDKLTTKVTDSGNSPALLILSNMYVDPRMDAAIQEHFTVRTFDGIARMASKLASTVKLGKTVASPATAIRNWTSAAWVISVHGGWNMEGMEKAIEVTQNILTGAQGDQYTQMLIDLGVVGDGIGHQGLLKLSQDMGVFDAMTTQEFSGVASQFSVSYLKGDGRSDPYSTVSKDKLALRKWMDLAFRFYQGADDFPKVMVFEKNRAMLAEAYETTIDDPRVIEEAALRVKETLFTYSKVNKAVKTARSLPVFTPPFISFPAEVIRTSINMGLRIIADRNSGNERLERDANIKIMSIIGTAVATEQLVGLIAQTIGNITDEDKELVQQMEGKFEKNQNIIPLHRFEDGSYEVLNMSRYNPYSILSMTISEILNDDEEGLQKKVIDTSMQFLEPFVQSDIFTQSVYEAIVKNDPAQSLLSPLSKLEDMVAIIMPAVTPTVINQMIRINQTFAGDSFDYGVGKRNPSREVSKLFGLSTQVMNPTKQLQFSSYDYSSTRNALEKDLRKMAKNLNANDIQLDFLVKGRIERAERDQQLRWGAMMKKVNVMKQAGMSMAKISEALSLKGAGKGAGGPIRKSEMDRLLRGLPAPRMEYPSDAVATIVNQVRLNSGAEAASDVRRRLNEIRRAMGY